MGRLAHVGLLPFLPLLLVPSPSAAQSLAIDHKQVGCVVAERFPVISARLDPAANVGSARVYFRAGGPHWYFVEMKVQGDEYLAALPKPKKSTAKIEYYIEALDTAFAASRTAEYTPRVVPPPGACGKDALAAASLTSAKLAVGVPAGAPAVPAGFSASGVATAGAAGAAVGAAGAGTGVSVGLVAGVVGAAAAIAGVAVAVRGGGGTTPSTQAPSMMAPAPTPTTTMPAPAPQDLTGQWAGTSPDGFIHTAGRCTGQQDDILATLTQSGSNLSGIANGRVRVAAPDPTCSSVGFQVAGPLTGTVVPGTISFTISFAADHHLACTGTYTNNRANGTWMRSDTGHIGAGTWSINRQ
jgi:hypothetical protein